MKTSVFLSRLVLVLFAFALSASGALASTTPDFAVFPGSTDSNTRFQYVVSTGDTIKDSIILENKSDETIKLKIDALDAFDDAGSKVFPIDPLLFDFELNPELPKVKFSENNMHMELNRDGSFIVSNPDAVNEYLGGWIKLESDLVTLAPGESANVAFTIKVPKDSSEYTTYIGGILVRYLDEKGTADGYGVSISTGVAERVYVDVLPSEVIGLYLIDGQAGFLKENLKYVLAGLILLLIFGITINRKRKK